MLALSLVLGLDDTDFKGWPVALILLVTAVRSLQNYPDIRGAWSLFVMLLAVCFSDGTGGIMGVLHIMALGIDLAAFIVALTEFPYNPTCVLSDSSGCQTLKAAIALDGVLWYEYILTNTEGRVLFLLTSWMIYAYNSGSSPPRGAEARRRRGVYYYR